MVLICGLDIGYDFKEQKDIALMIPVEMLAIPKTDNDIREMVKELNDGQLPHTVMDIFLICDKNLKILYKNTAFEDEDLASAFDTIEQNTIEIDEV